jgi:hypothetical protein
MVLIGSAAVEARHSAYIRNTNGLSPFPSPFDTPLDFNEVYSLAAQFVRYSAALAAWLNVAQITSCPSSNPTLPVKAFPVLTATANTDNKPLSWVKLTPKDESVLQTGGEIYAIWIGLTGQQVGVYDPSKMLVQIPYNGAGSVSLSPRRLHFANFPPASLTSSSPPRTAPSAMTTSSLARLSLKSPPKRRRTINQHVHVMTTEIASHSADMILP